jgi:hypothetical protein
MKKTFGTISLLAFSLLAVGGCGEESITGSSGGGDDLENRTGAIIRPTAQGGRNEVVMIYATAISGGRFITRTCSGSYFAPRVVMTAAHCLENIFFDQVFVYWGDNFAADVSQLTTTPTGFLAPPPVGQPSFWAKADSFEKHPSWDPTLDHPDMGAIYLDRKPPFDPLPLGRFRLDNSWVGRQVTITGWGGDVATSGTTTSGSRVQRTGLTHILGTPTAADYHPEDPNPGMLVDAVRQDVLKVDGHAPNSNGCFGDSGSPIIVNQFGQDYFAGVSYWTGLFCEDYSLYTRLDPFLPFLDAAYKKGGQETLIPNLECVAPNVAGTLTAYFGYNNKNGVGVTVPFGSKNQLALDVNGFRNSLFNPGAHSFAFGVDFTTSQTLSYSLAPDNSPRTTLTVNRNSLRCGAAQADQVECGGVCRASLRSGCPGLTFQACMSQCLDQVGFTNDVFPECIPQQQADDGCVARVPPGAANWVCSPFGFLPTAPACAAADTALADCEAF